MLEEYTSELELPGAAELLEVGCVAALKQEARTRVEQGTFFGHSSYVSVQARKR